MSKSFQPTFSSDVRVIPPRSPPANVLKDSEPFFQPTHRPVDTSPTVKCTGPDTHAAMQLSAGKLKLTRTLMDRHLQSALAQMSMLPDVSTLGRTGPDIAALQHQSAGKPHSDLHQPESLSSNSDPAPSRHQSTSKLVTD